MLQKPQIFHAADTGHLSNVLVPLARPELGIVNTALQSLSLEGYHEHFPATILHMHSLTWLCLSHGEFERLPTELSGLNSLRELQICFCHDLCVCSRIVLGMSLLQSLSLHRCSNRMIPEYFAEVKQIHPNLRQLIVH